MNKPSMNANADFISLLLGIFERGKYGERLTKDADKSKRAASLASAALPPSVRKGCAFPGTVREVPRLRNGM